MIQIVKVTVDIVRQIYRKLNKVANYPTITIEYPFVIKPLAKLARLEISNNFDECTGCRDCEQVCPVKAIEIVSEDYSSKMKRPINSLGQPFVGLVSQFQIDYNKCVFCGICVEACSAKSLGFDKSFVKPHYHSWALKTDLVHIPRSMRKDSL